MSGDGIRRWRRGITMAAAVAVAAVIPVISASSTSAAVAAVPIYQDTHFSFPQRAADLVSRMTLSEKVSQLHTSPAPAISRLGVQQYTYWNEGQHGVNSLGANMNNGREGQDRPTSPRTT